jgi:hypothetical protein
MSSQKPTLVTFRGGFVADWRVVEKVIQLEAKDARFTVLHGDRIQIEPAGLLDPDTRVFPAAHRAEAIAVLRYEADDSCGDSQASHVQQPEREA